MRKLASIQRIYDIKDHLNSDRLALAKVEGWQVVVRRGDFNEGDLVIFCEIDSILPPDSPLGNKVPLRIKSSKIRGEISQGVCFKPFSDSLLEIGQDVTEQMGITKYEPPTDTCLYGNMKGSFPPYAPRTDEIRVQNIPRLLLEYFDVPGYVTEKLDGTSCSIFFKDGEIKVCSRNNEYAEDEKLAYWKAANMYGLKEKLPVYGKNICLQGEVVGTKIQSNKYGITGVDLFIYSVYDIDNAVYLDFNGLVDTVDKLGLRMVPVLEKNFMPFHMVDAWLEYAEGKSVLNPEQEREGIVFRPMKELKIYSKNLSRLSYKVISNKFLLQNGD